MPTSSGESLIGCSIVDEVSAWLVDDQCCTAPTVDSHADGPTVIEQQVNKK